MKVVLKGSSWLTRAAPWLLRSKRAEVDDRFRTQVKWLFLYAQGHLVVAGSHPLPAGSSDFDFAFSASLRPWQSGSLTGTGRQGAVFLRFSGLETTD